MRIVIGSVNIEDPSREDRHKLEYRIDGNGTDNQFVKNVMFMELQDDDPAGKRGKRVIEEFIYP